MCIYSTGSTKEARRIGESKTGRTITETTGTHHPSRHSYRKNQLENCFNFFHSLLREIECKPTLTINTLTHTHPFSITMNLKKSQKKMQITQSTNRFHGISHYFLATFVGKRKKETRSDPC